VKLPTVDMKRWHVPRVDVRLKHHLNSCDLVIDVAMQVKNVETGEVGPVIVSERINGEFLLYEQDREVREKLLRSAIWSTVSQAVLHELAECLFVDGEQLRDPHPELTSRQRPARPNQPDLNNAGRATETPEVYGRSLAQVNQE
jgi:hypothetical protein